jgi:hypothetical protein
MQNAGMLRDQGACDEDVEIWHNIGHGVGQHIVSLDFVLLFELRDVE